MKTEETISGDQQNPTKASVARTDQAKLVTAADEQPMAKPSVVWFVVPIVIIALAIFLAR
jgi:hypothetical protein